MDRAATLKAITSVEKTETQDSSFYTRVIAISSGKGGVGKTNSSVNLAVALARMGRKVLLVDADLGLGNVDVLLGLAPRYNIGHLLRGERNIEGIMADGPEGVKILPAASGIADFTDLTPEQRLALCSHLESLHERFDVMIVDTGAGISSNVLFFNMASQEIVVVVSPEPTSLTDAYALMKVLNKKHGESIFKLLVNQVKTKTQGLEVYKKISLVAERFLHISVSYLGCVLADENVPKAVVMQKPVMELYPQSSSSKCYAEIAREIEGLPLRNIKGGMQFFWRKMLTVEN